MSRTTTRWHQRNARFARLIGCLLVALLCVAMYSADAGASQASTTESPTLADAQLGGPLVVPSVDQLMSGAQAQLARTARRSAPAAVARRAASHFAFEGLSAQTAIGETKNAFPALLDQSAGGVPQLSSDERIVRYPTSHAAQISLPGRIGVIEAIEPIASTVSHGVHAPFDLALTRQGDGYTPNRSPVALSVPSALSQGVRLPQLSISLTPVDRSGAALPASSGQREGAGVLWNFADKAGIHDLAALAKASPQGFDLSTLLFSQRSPSQLYFRVGMPSGAHLRKTREGAIQIVKAQQAIAVVSPVSAEDAEGTSVPVSVGVKGDLISVHVDTTGDYLYPIAVDPEVNDSQLAKTSAGNRSGWEFKTNSSHFSKNEATGGPGAERLEAVASGGYGPSEYGFWGYQTKGVSHIYELKTETSAHNNGAKVESFLEFEEPSGAQETKKILSTPLENSEYEHKAATLCAANASKAEECLPGSGKANNAVHFQQSTTGSSATGFSDSMTQGIVSIAEPTGTHSATSYNTTSPTLEFEAEVEGKKQKVTRANALYGSGSWLSNVGGALALNSSDPGIGVSQTKLEYERSIGEWRGLFEHNYLGVENACQGVQCYASHTEDATLPLGLPDGEDTLRYRAEEAISGTQSLESEGKAKVKVDTTKPHALQINGLPEGSELSERRYELTGEATDGEGATVASSGIKSLALFVDGHEVSTAGGSCTIAKGPCTASKKWTVNGAELGSGEHDIELVALDNASNESRLYKPISIHHSTPVAVGPGSVDLQSGNFAMAATDVSMGSGLNVSRSYSSRDTFAGNTGPLGPQWSLGLGSAESLSELVNGSVLLTDGSGKQTIFAALGGGKFASPTGDSSLEMSLEENKATKEKLAYYLKDPAAHTSVKFTKPAGSSEWLPSKQEGTTAGDTLSFSYRSVEALEEYPLSARSDDIVTGPDGNVWFTEESSKIGKLTPSGKLTEYAIPGSCPTAITVGVENDLWYTGYCSSTIGKITTSGTITEYPVPKNGRLSGDPSSITVGPEGNIWYTTEHDTIGKLTPWGLRGPELAVPANSHPNSITRGPDGELWFTEGSAGKIGKITTEGTITEYPAGAGIAPNSLIAGPDGNMWFTSQTGAKIGKITTSGSVTTYPVNTAGELRKIAVGPDDNLWFTKSESTSVGKITTSGTVTEYPMPTVPILGITAGPDGEMWFTRGEAVGKITTSGHINEPAEVLAPTSAGVSCEPELTVGCRALKFKYATSTTATGEGGAELGEYKKRLAEVVLKAYDPSSKAMKETAVAKYAYDKYGRLRAEWDPRISPNMKTTYGYDEEAHLTALAAPGQEPWALTYGTSAGDDGTGRLLKVTRAPASTALWKGEEVTNTGAPAISGTARVGVRMSVTRGTWSGSPMAYRYQWERCTTEVYNHYCAPILGATNPSYTPVATDVGDTLMATVTATNAGGSATSTAAQTATVAVFPWTEYTVAAGAWTRGMTKGPEAGTFWFSNYGTGKVGKITTAGAITEYKLSLSGPFEGPLGIVTGPDGNVWVASNILSKISKITPAGVVTQYALPSSSQPVGIAAGPDGKLWFAENSTSKIGKITTAGAITEYALPAGSGPSGIAAGPDGNLWFTNTSTSKVGKITTAGAITEYALPAGSGPSGIAAGPDGNLWFTNTNTSKVGKITTAGVITEYALPAGSAPEFIAPVSGALWVSGPTSKTLHKITTAGAISEYLLSSTSSPQALVAGSGEELWLVLSREKLAKALVGSLPEGEATSPEPGTTINYNVPLSGTGAPAQMSAAEVAKWGQSDDPIEATSITAPDEPQGWPASSYKRATTYYLDGQGRQVDVAAPSNSAQGAIATTEYNEFNDPIRSLTPGNRATALEAGAASVEKSKLLDTQNTYNGEGAKEGEVSEPGTRLIESDGPQHKVTYVAGHEQKESLARLHSKFFYDEGAPAGETYDLQTKKTTLAQLSNEEEVEVRTTKTSYSGQSNLGWKLRAPTSVASYGPEEAALSKSSTEYNSTTGQVTEVRGSSAESTLSYAKKFGEAGTEAGKLKAPWGTAVNAEGAVLVADSANNRIEKFSSEGIYVSSFGSLGSGSGQLKEPQGIALDASGNIWVADTGNNRIEEFSSAGAFVKTVGSLGTESGKLKAPAALAFDPKGNLWVTDTANNRIEKFNKEGLYVSEFGSAGSEPGKLAEPKGIAIDSGEHVWVADTFNNRIEEFSGTGSLLRRFGAKGSGEGQLNTPTDLKIDASGDIWTADSKNNRAEAFSPTGAYVTQIGSSGIGNGQLAEPKAIAFDATGKPWVSDSNNNRMEQWSKGPNAHDQKTIYYSTAANTEGYAACGSHPEYAGLTCETLPAKQPELMGLPALPTTTYTAYNIYNEPVTISEAFGSSTRTKKETYDAGGRRATSETTATSGKALPAVTFTYNSEQGVLEKESAEGKSLSSEYNRLGQLIKYTDADGNSAKYTYAGPENDYLLTEASDSSSSGTTKQSYEYDSTTKLRSKLIDSSAGSFTASYDIEGKLQSVSYPYGICAAYAYNSIGEATNLQYKKSSNCAEAEPGVYYSDTSFPSIRGEMLRQESTMANDTYAYDPSGRLTESQETPVGEGCTVRAYSYDEEANRATSSTRTPGTGGACQSEGGTTEAHNYDEANRLSDPGIAYDAYGNVTKLPAADVEGHELSSSYYVDNAVATQTQSGITNEYKLDPEGRTRELISGTTKTIDHYDGPGEAVAWSESPETAVRNIPGIDGTLLATQTNGGTPVLQLHDLPGDVIGTIGDKAGETKLLSSYNSSEFGVPNGKAPPKFAYLGAFGAESSFASGVITYGATSYVPQTARALQSEAVQAPGLPGGSGAGAAYTMQEEAWNMQGAARAAAEAPGLEAAREQAALEAAEGTFVDPWVHSTMNRSKAASLAEEYFEAEAFAVVAAMNDIPTDAVEALGQKFGDFLADFTDAYKWMYDAGTMLNKCANNKRKANGQAVNICWFEYDQIEWTPEANILGLSISLPVTLKFPNFSVEPRVNECIYVQGPSLECVANVYIDSEL
jgi:streptogramin lyase